MLDVMRSNARSSLIVVVFALIIASFIFSFGRGSSGFRTRTPETWAATVNGDLVTAGDFAQAYAQRFRQSSSARGGKYTTDDAKRDDLRRQVLRALEDQQLIAQHESAAIDWVRFTGFMFRDQVKPTDDEIAAYIKDHAKEIEEAYNKEKDTRYKQPAASKVRAITVPLPPGSTPEQEQAAQKR